MFIYSVVKTQKSQTSSDVWDFLRPAHRNEPIGSSVCGKSRTQYWRNSVLTARYSLRISACIWKWRRFCICTTCSATAGAAHTGHHRDCALSQPSTGAMRRRSISALLELKKEALLPYRPIWHRHTTTDAIKRNGF